MLDWQLGLTGWRIDIRSDSAPAPAPEPEPAPGLPGHSPALTPVGHADMPQPERTCIGCRTRATKSALTRVVWQPELAAVQPG